MPDSTSKNRPGREKPSLVVVPRQINSDKLYHAYANLESNLHSLECMTTLTSQLAENADWWADSAEFEDILLFSIYDVQRRVEELKEQWRAGFDAAREQAS